MLDTTLRDGAQTHDVSFSLQDKLSIAQRLDDLGVKYVEGGWPGSNPKDIEFFRDVKKLSFTRSEIVAFGSTRRKDMAAVDDTALNTLIDSDVKTVVVVGKAWRLHVTDVLQVTCEENLNMVRESVEYLKNHGLNVIFDAEHFFDGFKDDSEYALQVAEAVQEAGSGVIVLCDTNGGNLPQDIQSIVASTVRRLKVTVGIHCHNDLGLAVANTLAAVVGGAGHVQGTVNGLGERCGNADLCQILPTLHIKMGVKTLSSKKPFREQLKGLTSLSRYVYELANIPPRPYQPYVGGYAFAHKGGIHVDATLKEMKAYEQIDPALIGNLRELSVSELSGRASVVKEASDLGLKMDKNSELADRILSKIKRMEAEGYHFENAKASVHLMILREMGYPIQPFEVKYWRTTASNDEVTKAVGEVIVQVNSNVYHETSKGTGPVHALDLALRQAVLRRFPHLAKVKLANYKVTVIDSVRGTASIVRVFIEFEDDGLHWATTAVSPNILEASAAALTDGYTYRLVLDEIQKGKGRRRRV